MQPILLLSGLLGIGTANGAAGAETSLAGTWRFTHALPAPWGPAVPGGARLSGQTLKLAPDTMHGPHPLDCRGTAQLAATSLPAEGLFQGNLPAPARPAAEALGLGVFPVQGLSVRCDQGLFEIHQADADSLLLGLDNRVWALSRAAGTRASANSPAGRVQALLEQHFSGPMVLDQAGASNKAPLQSRRLNRLIRAYLARPRPPDEVPPINGDPYTNSQEQPTRFAVGKAHVRGARAWVPVVLADAWRRRVITYELVQESGAWQLDDLDDGHGGRLSQWLKM